MRLLLIVLLIIAVFAAGNYTDVQWPDPGGDTTDAEATATFYSDGDPVGTVTLAVAATPDARQTGLMEHDTLCDTCGMLFVYPEPAERSFWMKNTSLPLDIIFLNSTRHVVSIEQADPPAPGTPDDELDRYRSDAPAQYVIEVPQGYATERGITPGTRVRLNGVKQSRHE